MGWRRKKGEKKNIPGGFRNMTEPLRVGAGFAESPWWTPRCAFIIHRVWRISSSSFFIFLFFLLNELVAFICFLIFKRILRPFQSNSLFFHSLLPAGE